MLAATRRSAILDILRVGRGASVGELAQELGVSTATIRRDLDALDAEGRVLRVRGGGEALGTDPDGPFEDMDLRNTDQKEAIAVRAAQMVHDGDIVLLDIGTTTTRLAAHLVGKRITLITSSLSAVRAVEGDDGIDVVVLGGALRRSYHSLVGDLTATALGQVHADTCFLSTSGISRKGEVLDNTGTELPVKKAMIAASDRVILLADSSKYPGPGAMKVCGPADLDALITDQGVSAPLLDAFAEAGTEVITA
jgi:DeoR/GlpR family transcriptional regulator of sugar metabolism